MKRTWYFLRRNTLAIIGLAILLCFAGIAVYAATTPIPWTQMTAYCATNQVGGFPAQCALGFPQICTYPAGSTPPHPGCYETPTSYPSVVAPTLTLAPLAAGPLPLGSLTLNPSQSTLYNTYEGLLRGSDWSLMMSVTIVAGGALAGLLIGSISGFLGGVVDEVIMRLVDIFLSIPQLLFVIITVAVVIQTVHTIGNLDPTSSRVLLVILGFMAVWWPFYARVVRGQVLVVREQKFVEAARASGASRSRIITRHIVPNSVYPVFIQMSLDVGTIPLFIGTLVFLGFLIFPSAYFPSWGAITANSVFALSTFLVNCQVGLCVIPWWQLLFPGLTLFLYAISVNFLADGLRDALDPRLRR